MYKIEIGEKVEIELPKKSYRKIGWLNRFYIWQLAYSTDRYKREYDHFEGQESEQDFAEVEERKEEKLVEAIKNGEDTEDAPAEFYDETDQENMPLNTAFYDEKKLGHGRVIHGQL